MDQSELNAVVQKWLESLLRPAENQDNPASLTQQSGSQDLNEVLGKLRHLLRLSELPKTSLRAGGTHLVVLARSIAAYLQAALDLGDLERASRTFNQQTTKSLMAIFRLTGKKLTPYYHDDKKDGITRAAQMALYAKYEEYATRGAAVFHDKPPVFYISDTGYTSDIFNLCGSLGIPMSSCRLVPSSSGDSFNAMDVSELEQLVKKDVEKGNVPVMVIAYAGTPLAGHVENMAAIRKLCDEHKFWMHVQGHALSSMCLLSADQEVMECRSADSLTLYPGVWFGLLSSPCLTLHRTPYIVENELLENGAKFPPDDISLTDGAIPIPRAHWNGMVPGGMLRLLPLSLWLCIQYLGTSTLVETISYCQNLTKHMISRLDEVPGVKRFNIPAHQSFTVLFKYFGGGEVEFTSRISTPEGEEEEEAGTAGRGQEGGLEGQVTQDEDQDQETKEEGQGGNDEGQESKDEGQKGERPSKVKVEELAPATCNIANAMIARDLQAYFPKVGISPLKLPNQGVSFRFDPINSFPEHSTSLEDVDKFIDALKKRIESLHATALARRLIEVELKGQPNLRSLEFPSFFGSGFIQYVPTDWANKTDLTLEEVSELNQLNIELSNILAQKNPAFSPFQHGNFSCIMIKELQADVNIQEFIDSLLVETSTFEENRKFLAGMSEKIKKGIEAAQTDLIKEKEQKAQEEGYLRYVPIVGSVLSWFSPATPTTPQGRTFNLSSGRVEDTGTTYKYKMQVAGEDGKEHESDLAQPTSCEAGDPLPEQQQQPSEEGKVEVGAEPASEEAAPPSDPAPSEEGEREEQSQATQQQGEAGSEVAAEEGQSQELTNQ